VLRIFMVYAPLRFFGWAAFIAVIPGLLVVLRFLFNYAVGEGEGNLQSLVLSTVFFAIAGLLAMGGLLAELIAVNRTLLEEIRLRQLRADLNGSIHASLRDQAALNVSISEVDNAGK